MDLFSGIDWRSLFQPTVSMAEIFVRGTLTYLFLYTVLRVLRRQAGALSISDLLVVVLIADAAQNAMAGQYNSITEGVALITTIAFWDYFLDWLGDRFPRLGRILRPPPLLLIRDGVLQKGNMRREMITEDELIGQLREQGVEDVSMVKRSFLESDGRISVVKRKSQD